MKACASPPQGIEGIVSLLVNKKHAIATSFHMAGMLRTLQHIV